MQRIIVMKDNQQAGFTLVEALVVMLVGIVILAAAAAGINKLFHASEISTAANNISQLQTSVRGLKNGAEGYKDLTNSVAFQLKAVPANMVVGSAGEKIKNAWGGDVTIKPTTDNQSFEISYEGVPEEACQQLVLKLRNAGWEKIAIADKAMDTYALADIQKACTGGAKKLTFTANG